MRLLPHDRRAIWPWRVAATEPDLRHHSSTMLTALRMTDQLDAGPVYGKRPLSLAGRAEDIFSRAAELTYDLIDDIIKSQEPRPDPTDRRGGSVPPPYT